MPIKSRKQKRKLKKRRLSKRRKNIIGGVVSKPARSASAEQVMLRQNIQNIQNSLNPYVKKSVTNLIDMTRVYTYRGHGCTMYYPYKKPNRIEISTYLKNLETELLGLLSRKKVTTYIRKTADILKEQDEWINFPVVPKNTVYITFGNVLQTVSRAINGYNNFLKLFDNNDPILRNPLRNKEELHRKIFGDGRGELHFHYSNYYGEVPDNPKMRHYKDARYNRQLLHPTNTSADLIEIMTSVVKPELRKEFNDLLLELSPSIFKKLTKTGREFSDSFVYRHVVSNYMKRYKTESEESLKGISQLINFLHSFKNYIILNTEPEKQKKMEKLLFYLRVLEDKGFHVRSIDRSGFFEMKPNLKISSRFHLSSLFFLDMSLIDKVYEGCIPEIVNVDTGQTISLKFDLDKKIESIMSAFEQVLFIPTIPIYTFLKKCREMKVLQSTLLKAKPGIHYNFVCRTLCPEFELSNNDMATTQRIYRQHSGLQNN